MNRRFLIVVLALLAISLPVFANGDSDMAASGGTYPDGVYFAQEDGFAESGWKYVVTIIVKDGKIVSADWNGAYKMGGMDKKSTSKAGKYPMVEKGGAKADWHVQAESTEKWLLKTQDPTAMNLTDAAGHTDSITGVSITAGTFAKLAEKALAKGPVGYGKYKDGAYQAEEAEFPQSGWKSNAKFTVISGYVVAAWWDGVNKDGMAKKKASEEGKYPMVANGGAKADWHVQAKSVEDYFIATQGVAPKMDAEGHADAISGCQCSCERLLCVGCQGSPQALEMLRKKQ